MRRKKNWRRIRKGDGGRSWGEKKEEEEEEEKEKEVAQNKRPFTVTWEMCGIHADDCVRKWTAFFLFVFLSVKWHFALSYM